MTTNPQKPWKAEYAKSGRSSCKTCKDAIGKKSFRLGKIVQSFQFDALMPMWHHAACILEKANQINSFDDVEGIEALRSDDQQKIKEYIDNGGTSKTTTDVSSSESGIEVSSTSRATCKGCSQKIMKGEVRISFKPDGQGDRSLVWHHANCFFEMFSSAQVETLPGWASLSDSNQTTVLALSKKDPPTAKSVKNKKGGKEMRQSTKGDKKRKKEASIDPESKIVKKGKNNGKQHQKESDLESKLEIQSKEISALKDDFENHEDRLHLHQM